MTIRRMNTVNMTDVALRAGVSQSTVSRVINNHPGISRRTRQSVLDALRILGYKSEILSLIQPQREKYEFSVTLLMCPLPEQRDPFALEYFSILADGVRDGLAGENVKFQLRTLRAGTEEPPEFEAERDSVILVGYPSEGLRRNLREAGIDYLITSGDIYSDTEDMVTVNNFEVGEICCRWLLDQGAHVTVLDSPGFGRAESVARAIGLAELLRPLGLAVTGPGDAVPLQLDNGSRFGVSRRALECDKLILTGGVVFHFMAGYGGAARACCRASPAGRPS